MTLNEQFACGANSKVLMVTCGTYNFPELSNCFIYDAVGFIQEIRARFNIHRCIIQKGGASDGDGKYFNFAGVEVVKFMEEKVWASCLQQAHYIIAHAGVGSFVSILKYARKDANIIFTCNDKLTDFHQDWFLLKISEICSFLLLPFCMKVVLLDGDVKKDRKKVIAAFDEPVESPHYDNPQRGLDKVKATINQFSLVLLDDVYNF